MANVVEQPVVVAAFDVDGTLTRRDCVVPFLWRLGAGRLLRGMARHAGSVARALVRRDRDRLKEIATAAVFTGRPVADVERLAAVYGHHIRGWVRDDTVGRLRWHQEQGHRTVLVSASYELYLTVLGHALDVDAVLGSVVGTDGTRFTGELVGGNCRGAEKARRLHDWLAGPEGVRGGRAGAVLWAYGDSAGDRELLAAADHPVWATARLSSVPSTE